MYDGPRDPVIFKENGREFLDHYRKLCGLEPHESVLDVGSGMGRKTLPLVDYLSPDGRYLGLDVNKKGVRWCREVFATRHPGFTFQEIDVRNPRYNPKGSTEDSEYSFPVPDGSIDFLVMASVLTHMLPQGVDRYLKESARVLKPGTGRCLVSFFLLNEESEAGIEALNASYRFLYRRQDHAVEDPHRPEDAVAYGEDWVVDLIRESDLEIHSIHRGSWSGRPGSLSFQDLVVARKAS
jgi:ubiquinone/menaquinone biosynthesis C-methylase UbiE